MSFPPPAIPGIGTSGGVTFILEDRAGKESGFSPSNTQRIHGGGAQASGNRAGQLRRFIPSVPQVFADVDRDKVLKQGVNLTRRRTRRCRHSWAASW